MSTNPPPIPPEEIHRLDQGYARTRANIAAAVESIAYALTRSGPAEVAYHSFEAARNVNPLELAQAYAVAIVELARLRNEAEGKTLDPAAVLLPPDVDDKREAARIRTERFCNALRALCLDHGIAIVAARDTKMWLVEAQVAIDAGYIHEGVIAQDFHWCPPNVGYAAGEPVDLPGYEADPGLPPWKVPDGHE
jgi:hypothetical protein